RKAGAVGIATIANPRPQAARSGPETEQPGGEGRGAGRGGRGGGAGAPVAFLLADRSLQGGAGQSVSLTITTRGAVRFFEGSGHTFEEIQNLARANEPLPRFPLSGSLRVKASVKRGALVASNVAALLPGSDRKLKSEYVVISAHLDHLGM